MNNTTTLYRRIKPLPILRWDGNSLIGGISGRPVEVAVPMRLVACRIEIMPPAPYETLKAAARLKADRSFAVLGPVSVDAIFSRTENGMVAVTLLALPQSCIEAIKKATKALRCSLVAVRVSELMLKVPEGGLVETAGEACLVAMANGQLQGISALGPVASPGFTQALARERLRLGLALDAPGGDAPGCNINFVHPGLSVPGSLMARTSVRIGLITVGVATVLLLMLGLRIADALECRNMAINQAVILRKDAQLIASYRNDIREIASWFQARHSLGPSLHALVQALPDPESIDQVRLIRLRKPLDQEVVAEGSAGNRIQMMNFLERLRRDPRIASAQIRSSRGQSKDSQAVIFELVFRLTPGDGINGDGHASS